MPKCSNTQKIKDFPLCLNVVKLVIFCWNAVNRVEKAIWCICLAPIILINTRLKNRKQWYFNSVCYKNCLGNNNLDKNLRILLQSMNFLCPEFYLIFFYISPPKFWFKRPIKTTKTSRYKPFLLTLWAPSKSSYAMSKNVKIRYSCFYFLFLFFFLWGNITLRYVWIINLIKALCKLRCHTLSGLTEYVIFTTKGHYSSLTTHSKPGNHWSQIW